MRKSYYFLSNYYTMYQIMLLACKFSHYRLFKYLANLIIDVNNYNLDNNNLNNNLNHNKFNSNKLNNNNKIKD